MSFFESSPDHGVYDAWNRVLPHAKGEWICFIGADDYFLKERALSAYATYLAAKSNSIRIVYGINHVVNSNNDLLFTIGEPWSEAKKVFSKKMNLPHQGMMHRRRIFDEYGKFKTSFKIAGDYELLLRVLKHQDADFMPYSVCATPIGGLSTQPSNNLKCILEIYKARSLHGYRRLDYTIIMGIIGSIIRIVMWQIFGEHNTRAFLDKIRKLRGLDAFWTRAV